MHEYIFGYKKYCSVADMLLALVLRLFDTGVYDNSLSFMCMRSVGMLWYSSCSLWDHLLLCDLYNCTVCVVLHSWYNCSLLLLPLPVFLKYTVSCFMLCGLNQKMSTSIT